MLRQNRLAVVTALCAVFAGGLFVLAQEKDKKAPESSEKKVKEADVPKAALEALKKLAGASTITEFAEEMEHGKKFYEGTWKGADGEIDALVTETGDLVELGEITSADKVPAAVRATADKEAGKDAKVVYEKKTYIVYEAQYKKGEKKHEVMIMPDGSKHEEHGEKKGDKEEDQDDHD